MNNRIALNPQHSVVVESCAGSGKTWLLVSRIVRLLLDGVKPGEILAITFTRKAAQEMQARLHGWLQLLAVKDDDEVREFLRERALEEGDGALLARARGLYRDVLLAQPAITISTFHGWFMQVIQRAPLNAGAPVGMQLLERTSALREEAWQAFADSLRDEPDGELAREMQWLFEKYGLHGTRSLLESFVAKRAEWWAYSSGQQDAVAWAVERLRAELGVDEGANPVADACADASFHAAVREFVRVLATGTETQCNKADEIQTAWEMADARERFAALQNALYTQADEPRSFKPTKKQNAEVFLLAREALSGKLQAVRDALADLEAVCMNRAALRCGAALLEHYQELKLRQQQMDFTDLEWQVYRLLNRSDCAEYMQYKLDSRYRHVLLDEFQDTNPLQWQILQAWFAAAAEAGSRPTVFVVGDPKQSIYRFRRADARLFGEARKFLQQEFSAQYLAQNKTRRNSPAVLQAVNGVFADRPDDFPGFVEHVAHHQDLPGYVEVLPLAAAKDQPPPARAGEDGGIVLRNPLITPREEMESGAREAEAEQFAGRIADIAANWIIQGENGVARRAGYGDIMVLVRKRTHLRVYEHALRARHIPFFTSRRGGLLDTLEAEDLQALLTFLITPFADLALAQALRSPLFACFDEDLMRLAEISLPPNWLNPDNSLEPNQFLPPCRGKVRMGVEQWNDSISTPSLALPLHPQGVGHGCKAAEAATTTHQGGGDISANGLFRLKGEAGENGSWWLRLQHAVASEASPQLQRAHRLLQGWLQLADKLPVHDLLDRIYFEGDLIRRYAAALPAELREAARANLHAFMEIALNVDAGRYPSLPRFLAELRELRAAEEEAPDEGKAGESDNALRIYTVHEAKGLEAPIVWLLDANDMQRKADSYGVLLKWPTGAPRPAHFSLYPDKRGRGNRRAQHFAEEEKHDRREEMNLLYVAMTRARQALLVSGSGELAEESWYGRIARVAGQGGNPLQMVAASPLPPEGSVEAGSGAELALLRQPVPTGRQLPRITIEQQRGTWLHALLQHLAPSLSVPEGEAGEEMAELQARCGIPPGEMEPLWQQVQHLLALPAWQRFFDPLRYRNACNEMPCVNARGELKRIDRLVEFDDEVWVLDYKSGPASDVAPHRAQLREYRDAMQSVWAGKKVYCALLFGDGTVTVVE